MNIYLNEQGEKRNRGEEERERKGKKEELFSRKPELTAKRIPMKTFPAPECLLSLNLNATEQYLYLFLLTGKIHHSRKSRKTVLDKTAMINDYV